MPRTQPHVVAGFGGSLIGPEDSAYDAARSIWNSDVDRRPQLIAWPRDADDVARALRWAGDRGLPVSVLGGGHNVSGAALCDGLVVDLADLRAVSVDVPGRRAHVEGGARWRDVDAVTQAHGLVVPGGVMSLTGVAGLTLGGGLGWLRRALGLSSDQVTAFDLVTAAGEQLHVDGDSGTVCSREEAGAAAHRYTAPPAANSLVSSACNVRRSVVVSGVSRRSSASSAARRSRVSNLLPVAVSVTAWRRRSVGSGLRASRPRVWSWSITGTALRGSMPTRWLSCCWDMAPS